MPRVLIVGIAIGGLIAGFMIGASSSPVVAAVIPALLSGIVSALALIFKSPSTDPESKKLPNTLGLILIAFFAPYGLGLGSGILVKTHEWLVVKPTVPSSLAKLTKSADNLEDALLRIDVYRALQTQGFNDDLAGHVAGLSPNMDISIDYVRKLLADLSPNVRSDETIAVGNLPPPPLEIKPEPALPKSLRNLTQFARELLAVDAKMPPDKKEGIYRAIFDDIDISLEPAHMPEVLKQFTDVGPNAQTLIEVYQHFPEKDQKIDDLLHRLQQDPTTTPVLAPLPTE